MVAEIALLEAIADRLAFRLMTTDGERAPHDHVADVVEAAARSLAGAPLQQYAPLLVENAARTTLCGEGVHFGAAPGL